jgi:hypothetical protein
MLVFQDDPARRAVGEVLGGISLSTGFWLATGLPVVLFGVAFAVLFPPLWGLSWPDGASPDAVTGSGTCSSRRPPV